MSFLAPWVLWGLIAASIPIIIHLLSIRRTAKIEFSTIQFIQKLEHETIRKLKLRQILLLILRTLVIIFIIMAFARPVKVGYFTPWSMGDMETRLVVVMDNSASMEGRFESKSHLEKSKEIIADVLQQLEGKIDLQIYQLVPFDKIYDGDFVSGDEIRKVLNTIEQTPGSDHLWDSIIRILDAQEFALKNENRQVNKEVFVFSDFPASDISDLENLVKKSLSEYNDWRFYLFNQPSLENNISISQLKVESQLILSDHLFDISSAVKNQSNDQRKDIPIQLYISENRVGQVVSDFDADQTREFQFQVYPDKTGYFPIFLELPKDDYVYDNIKYLHVSVPPKINCSVLSSSQDDLKFITSALDAINSESEFVTVNKIIPSSTLILPNGKNHVLILVDPGVLQSNVMREIERYIDDGGNVILFTGNNYASAYKSSIPRKPFPSVEEVVSLEHSGFHTVKTIKMEHPVFSDFPLADLQDELPHVYSHVKLKYSGHQESLLSLSNGNSLLSEIQYFDAKLLLFSVLPNIQWSNLPIKGIFVPLMHRLLVYLVANKNDSHTVTVYDSLSVAIEQHLLNSEIMLVKPSGRERILVPDFTREEVVIGNITEVGVYSIVTDGRKYRSFSANVSNNENPDNRLIYRQLAQIFPDSRTRIVNHDEEPLSAVREARRGVELWRIFMFAVLGILILESWIGRNKEHEKKIND